MFSHPKEHGFTYLQHMMRAMKFCVILLGLSGAAIIHAFLPCFFITTVSDKIKRLAKALVDDYQAESNNNQ